MDVLNDPLLQGILATTEEPKPEIGKNVWAEFPDEVPTKVQLISWTDSWRDSLESNGFGAYLRGELPYELQKLKPRPLIHIPESAEAGKKAVLEAKNSDIEYQNSINESELEARKLEVTTRVASKLRAALRPRAPLKLKALLAKHQCKDSRGNKINDAYDGVAMFLEIEGERTKDVGDYD